MNVNVEGAIVTRDIASALKGWQQNDNVPEHYVEYLCDMQDFFCRLLLDHQLDIDDTIINQFLKKIITMKDDLKMFYVNSTCY
jgi:hypothetical protein